MKRKLDLSKQCLIIGAVAQPSIAGRLVAHWRSKADLTQAELARKVGVTPQAVGSWERGDAVPTEENVVRVAHALGMSLRRFYAAPPAEAAAG